MKNKIVQILREDKKMSLKIAALLLSFVAIAPTASGCAGWLGETPPSKRMVKKMEEAKV